MKLKELVTDIRSWLFLIGFVAVAATSALGWWKLPGQVEEVRVKTDKNCDHVQKVAESVDKYIAVQSVKDVEREKRHEDQIKHQDQQNESMWKVLDHVAKDK